MDNSEYIKIDKSPDKDNVDPRNACVATYEEHVSAGNGFRFE